MKPKTAYLHLLLLVLAVQAAAQTNSGPADRELFNNGWLFTHNDPAGAENELSYRTLRSEVLASGNELVSDDKKKPSPDANLGSSVEYTRKEFDDGRWRRINLPHDWAIESDFRQELPSGSGKLPWAGVGWYRKHFNISAADKGKRIFIDFDGAMAYPAIWLNGKFVGGWAYGYQSFRLDLTPYIDFGKENVIAVRLENPLESSRWYPGSGIYRIVWLVKTDPVHIAHWGTAVSLADLSGKATLHTRVSIENDSANDASVDIATSFYELSSSDVISGKPVATSQMPGIKLPPFTTKTFNQFVASIEHPKLWSIESPSRYVAVTTVREGKKVTDTYRTVFGLRTIEFDKNKGFLLNGKHVYLKGVCDHHDLGALGSAINYRALQRQLEILKEMGVNAIRTSHNPPSPELLELADKMGFVVMDEAFDAWKRVKMPNDYGTIFEDWHERDWRAQLRRDRNHPSVVLWSIGNEIWEQGDEPGHQIARELTAIAHKEDPTRPTTAAANDGRSGFNGFQDTVDVFGYNYRWKEYERFRKENPDKAIFGSETASAVSSRGEYFFPVSDDKAKGRANFQVSSYDLYAPPWAWPPDAEFAADDKNPFIAGEFVWTGFDYLGEPTPYDGDNTTALTFTDPSQQAAADKELAGSGKIIVPSRSSYFGILDLAGFKKDRFYIYQARWRPDLPMAHILPHWNWPERVGQVTPVHVYTSGDEAELFLNGKSLGRKKRGQYEYRLRWDDVVYEPGELHVVAYKNGKKWAEDTMKTTGEASHIQLSADRPTIKADGYDLSFITVRITDKNGLTVPRTHNRLNFQISGPGVIAGIDNGDPTDHDPFQSRSRRAFNGLALVIVRSVEGQTGSVSVKVASDGLRSTKINLVTK